VAGHRQENSSRSPTGGEAPPERKPRPIGIAIIALVLGILAITIGGIALQRPADDEIVIRGAPQVQREIGGLPQLGARLGSSNAPVTVQVFNDLQCAACRKWQRDVVDPLIAGPVPKGQVKLVFRHFSQSQHGTTVGAIAATAAGRQGRQWQYIQVFFLNQAQAKKTGVTDEFLRRIGRSSAVTFDLDAWSRQRRSPKTVARVEEDAAQSEVRRLPTGPAVVVDGPRGSRTLIQSPSLADVRRAIAAVGGTGA